MSSTDVALRSITVAEAARAIKAGDISATELIEACLARIDEVDAEIEAWAFLDRDYALAQADLADKAIAAGGALGALHGVPLGLKDIIDTRDLPTENGTVLHAGRRPIEDAAVVSMLRQVGALVMGKTVPTELAVYAPGKTRNPHDPERTPGGSSSGSAAAVAAHMVPGALGTQTNGSIIRPASYCGVCGYKPTHGLISRTGILPQSRWLDTVGVIARTVEDAALIAQSIMSYDARDPDMRALAVPPLAETAMSEPPVDPDLVFIKTPAWVQLDEDARQAFTGLVDLLGRRCEEQALPDDFEAAWRYHRSILVTDLARSFRDFYARGKAELSESLTGMIEEGQQCRAVDYAMGIEWQSRFNLGLDVIFDEYDAIVTPATTGEAPLGLESTGSPALCTLWTYLGTPAITLPLLQGSHGLPLGVQLVGRRGNDARLLRTARWLARHVADLAEEPDPAGDLDKP